MKSFSIRDSKGEFFNQPFFARTHGEAERNFRMLINDEKSMINKYPEDYSLWHIGEFDDQTGKLVGLPTPSHISNAILPPTRDAKREERSELT